VFFLQHCSGLFFLFFYIITLSNFYRLRRQQTEKVGMKKKKELYYVELMVKEFKGKLSSCEFVTINKPNLGYNLTGVGLGDCYYSWLWNVNVMKPKFNSNATFCVYRFSRLDLLFFDRFSLRVVFRRGFRKLRYAIWAD
jgi:hypothetical protein